METGVPDMVIPGPPGTRDVPAMLRPVGFAVKILPSMVKTEVGDPLRGIMSVPRTSPEAPSDTRVPEMVTAGPLGMTDVPAMVKPLAFAVNT